MFLYFKQFLLWPLYIVSHLIPKDNKIWVFSAWIGKNYSDNSRYLYEHVSDNKEDIEAYWVTKDKQLYKKLACESVRCVYMYSLHGLFIQARAGVAIFTHSQFSEFMPGIIVKRVKRIQLWHGSPLKKIGSDVKGTFKDKHPLLFALRNLLYPWFMMEDYSLITSASNEVSNKFKGAFDSNKVVATGYPRNDAFKINNISNWTLSSRKIIYMPTFRGKVGNNTDNNETCNTIVKDLLKNKAYLAAWFNKNKIKLVLRLHPSNYPTKVIAQKIDSLDWLELYSGPSDIYEIINEYDMLITDYSSIFFDYFLTGKPIIHAPLDLMDYIDNSRQLYYEYCEISVTDGIESWKDIINFMEVAIDYGLPASYIEKYNAITNRFNKYHDNGSSERVYLEINNLL